MNNLVIVSRRKLIDNQLIPLKLEESRQVKLEVGQVKFAHDEMKKRFQQEVGVMEENYNAKIDELQRQLDTEKG